MLRAAASIALCHDAAMSYYGQITGTDGVEGSWLIELHDVGVFEGWAKRSVRAFLALVLSKIGRNG
jgi:hypothetical protein